jgi:hypothetical protein
VHSLEFMNVTIKGHVKILEFDTLDDYKARNVNGVLLDKDNAVHKENASIVLARGITHRPNGSIFFMYFGNGGAAIDPLGNVVLNPPVMIHKALLMDMVWMSGTSLVHFIPTPIFVVLLVGTSRLANCQQIR